MSWRTKTGEEGSQVAGGCSGRVEHDSSRDKEEKGSFEPRRGSGRLGRKLENKDKYQAPSFEKQDQ